MLINGDCLEEMKTIKDNSVDIVIADLPYGRFKNLDWDKTIDLKLMWVQLWRIAKDEHTPIFLFGDMKFGVQLINSQPKYFKQEIVWNKKATTTPFLSRKRPGKATEYIFIFYKKQPVYNYAKYHKIVSSQKAKKAGAKLCHYHQDVVKFKPVMLYEPKLPINVINCIYKKHKKLIKKITEKPQEILEWILKYYSNEGDTCLDFCMGSGSCGVACKTLSRIFIGIEKKKEHFDICVTRLNK